MMNLTRNDCLSYLKEHDNYLLLTHIRPDGDTLGSAAALCRILRRCGKNCYLLPNAEITDVYVPLIQPYFAPEDYRFETVLSVDVATERLLPSNVNFPVDFCIDHHPTNSNFAAQTYCRPECAACGEIILDLAEALVSEPDVETANLLYIAVSTDTGCFVYANTTADTHRAAEKLIRAGAEIKPLNKTFFRTFRYSRLKLEGLIYNTMCRYHNGEVNVAVVTKRMMADCEADENDCEDIASLVGRIAGSRISVTVRELDDGESKVSIRSDEFFDSSAICALHGGGGHRMAAGCSLMLSPEETANIIVREIEDALR